MSEPVDRSFLFADVKGYSGLVGSQYGLFVRHVLPEMATAVKTYHPEHKNTWGDAIFAVFEDSHCAANCAFELCETFHKTNWEEIHLPELEIRIALHAGRCQKDTNPLTDGPEYLGNHVNLAARIEPIVGGNQVWATKHFRDMLTSSPFRPLFEQNLGERELVKKAGKMQLWRISRFPFDLQEAIEDDFYQNLGDRVHGVHHINLPVTDLLKSIEFYKNTLHLKQLPQAYDARGAGVIKAYCEEYGLPILLEPLSHEILLQGRYRLPFTFPGVWFDMPNMQQLHLILYRPGIDKCEPTLRRSADDQAYGPNFKDVHFALRVKDYDAMLDLHERDPSIKVDFGPMGQQYYLTDPDSHIIEITGMNGPALLREDS